MRGCTNIERVYLRERERESERGERERERERERLCREDIQMRLTEVRIYFKLRERLLWCVGISKCCFRKTGIKTNYMMQNNTLFL